MAVPYSRYTNKPQNVMAPPRTQNNKVAPTLFVYPMILEGVEYMPVPTTRLMIKNAVDQVPSLRSSGKTNK
jgi:hypothetical protein